MQSLLIGYCTLFANFYELKPTRQESDRFHSHFGFRPASPQKGDCSQSNVIKIFQGIRIPQSHLPVITYFSFFFLLFSLHFKSPRMQTLLFAFPLCSLRITSFPCPCFAMIGVTFSVSWGERDRSKHPGELHMYNGQIRHIRYPCSTLIDRRCP